jgi:hypothetical protein
MRSLFMCIQTRVTIKPGVQNGERSDAEVHAELLGAKLTERKGGCLFLMRMRFR